jgi:hypothetical protein
MTTRRENWPDLLAKFIHQRRSEPFQWGFNDCCIFAADWVDVCTGTDYAEKWRGRYWTAIGARRFLDDAGGVEALVDSLGLDRIQPQRAGRGDIVAQDAGRGITLGICLGVTTAFVAKTGLVFGSIENAKTAWKI